jgi:hypothetical protein
MTVAHEHVATVGRKSDAMWLRQCLVVEYIHHLPILGIHYYNPVCSEAGYENPAAAAREERLERAVGKRNGPH